MNSHSWNAPCFKLGKNATETWKAGSLLGMMRGVGGVRKSIDLS